jgi:uncharacterized protein YggE
VTLADFLSREQAQFLGNAHPKKDPQMPLPKLRRLVVIALLIAVCLFIPLPPRQAFGQLAGSRGGVYGQNTGTPNWPEIAPEVVERYITIEGVAETRVEATHLRIVLALTSEGENAMECHAEMQRRLSAVESAWKTMGIPNDSIHRDFIAILPRYQWQIETQNGSEVAIERLAGYRMQVNMHVEAQGESEANAVIEAAFAHDVTDIIAFDYWNPEIDELKTQTLKEATAAAKTKGETMFAALFDETPRVVNLQTQTKTHFPASLYESFENAYSETIDLPSRRNLPSMNAWRPKNTYYLGLQSDGDVTPNSLRLKPEITVVARVRLYYLSPAYPPRNPN